MKRRPTKKKKESIVSNMMRYFIYFISVCQTFYLKSKIFKTFCLTLRFILPCFVIFFMSSFMSVNKILPPHTQKKTFLFFFYSYKRADIHITFGIHIYIHNDHIHTLIYMLTITFMLKDINWLKSLEFNLYSLRKLFQ